MLEILNSTKGYLWDKAYHGSNLWSLHQNEYREIETGVTGELFINPGRPSSVNHR